MLKLMAKAYVCLVTMERQIFFILFCSNNIGGDVKYVWVK